MAILSQCVLAGDVAPAAGSGGGHGAEDVRVAWLGQFTVAQVHRLGLWFVTENRWVRAQLRTIHRRIVDALNADPDGMLLVEAVQAHDRRRRPHGLTPSRGGIAVSQALFCVPIEDETTPPAPRDQQALVVKTPERVELGLGPFEVSGYLHLPTGCTVCDTLGVVPKRFIVLTDARVRHQDEPALCEEFPVVVINGSRVEYLVPAEAVEGDDEESRAAPISAEAAAATV